MVGLALVGDATIGGTVSWQFTWQGGTWTDFTPNTVNALLPRLLRAPPPHSWSYTAPAVAVE